MKHLFLVFLYSFYQLICLIWDFKIDKDNTYTQFVKSFEENGDT